MVVYLKKQEVSQNQGPQHEEDENEHFNPVMEATIAISVGLRGYATRKSYSYSGRKVQSYNPSVLHVLKSA